VLGLPEGSGDDEPPGVAAPLGVPGVDTDGSLVDAGVATSGVSDISFAGVKLAAGGVVVTSPSPWDSLSPLHADPTRRVMSVRIVAMSSSDVRIVAV
jgi:hypothetical protein